MQIFAHLDPAAANGLRAVSEIIKVADDVVLGRDLYVTADDAFALACVPCASTVAAGMLYDPVAKTFAPAPVPPVDLGALKARLKTQVDADAEALRLTLITPGSAQAMEYQEAYAEAVQVDAAVKANANATFDPAAFPMLAASLGYDLDPETGKATTDIPGEARAVLAAYDAYQKAGAAIRATRLKGKAAIDAAATAPAAQGAFDAVAWPDFAAAVSAPPVGAAEPDEPAASAGSSGPASGDAGAAGSAAAPTAS